MGKLIVHNAITVNGAFESPAPDEWLVLDNDSADDSLEQFLLADAMVLGRKTFEGLAAVWLSSATIRRSAASPTGSTGCPSTSHRER